MAVKDETIRWWLAWLTAMVLLLLLAVVVLAVDHEDRLADLESRAAWFGATVPSTPCIVQEVQRDE